MTARKARNRAFVVFIWRIFSRWRRARAFATVSITLLGLGIGINAAMISLIDSLLLRPPLHVRDPDRVVRLQIVREEVLYGRSATERTNYPTLLDLASTRAFDGVAGFVSPGDVAIDRGASAFEA